MATRRDGLMRAAERAAKQAKQWARVAAREADRLLADARKRAASLERRRHLKRKLAKTARIMKAAGRAAVMAGVAAGVAAARAEQSGGRKRVKGRKR